MQGTQNSQNQLQKEQREIILSKFNTKAVVIKTVRTDLDQWNRTESRNKTLHTQSTDLNKEIENDLLKKKGGALTTECPRAKKEPGSLLLLLSCFSHVQLFATLWTVAHQAFLSMVFPGKNTGVSCHFLLQGIFPIQGSKPGLLHYDSLLLISDNRKKINHRWLKDLNVRTKTIQHSKIS